MSVGFAIGDARRRGVVGMCVAIGVRKRCGGKGGVQEDMLDDGLP